MRRRARRRRGAHARSAAVGGGLTDLIVIPARYGSTRLPGKPLRAIAGRTLLERTIGLARQALAGLADTDLVVATDHVEIAAHAEALGCDVTMTPAGIASGSDRTLAAAHARAERPGIVVNLQGDSPFLPVAALREVLFALRDGGAPVATPVVQLGWDALDALRIHKQASPFSGTTCVRGADGRALWFSKAILPAIRSETALRAASALSPVWRHIGLYGFRLAVLEAFAALPPSPHELLEGLEQLRLLENGIAIQSVAVAPPRFDISGIDTPEDIVRAEALIAEHGDPFVAPDASR